MKAIVPAAGIGTRLRPQTLTTPKVLINVAGRPIIEHILDMLVDAGIDDIVVVVGFNAAKVVRYLRENYPDIVRTVEQHERRGLGHAVQLALEDKIEPTLIMLGDTIFDLDLKDVLKRNNSAIGVKTVKHPQAFGIVELEGEYILRMVEKPDNPKSNLAISGIYYVSDQSLLKREIERLVENNITTRDEIQLTDALQAMVESGHRIKTFDVKHWYDCGGWQSILETNRILLQNGGGNNASVGGSVINQPCYIDPEAQVLNSIIGPFATLDVGAVVKNSILSDSVVGRAAQLINCSIAGSLIGERAVVNGSVRCMNVSDYSEIRFD